MVLYYSGTGNSKFIAKCIASALETDCLNLNERIKAGGHLVCSGRGKCNIGHAHLCLAYSAYGFRLA